jgi:hypothetical protein
METSPRARTALTVWDARLDAEAKVQVCSLNNRYSILDHTQKQKLLALALIKLSQFIGPPRDWMLLLCTPLVGGPKLHVVGGSQWSHGRDFDVVNNYEY